MLRVGVVLGAGGSVGLAFHGGVLAAIEEATGWDPRTAEVVVGTSAGSLSAALLRIGLPAADLRRVSEGVPLSADGARLAEIGAPHRPRAARAGFLRPRLPADVTGVALGVLRPWARTPGALAAALLPSGPVDTAPISAGLDRVAGEGWPESPLWVTTVRLRDGRRVVFGQDGAPTARLGQAVAASCAIPAYFRPVAIGRDRYVDGGVASIHNLDLLAEHELDLVVVSAPMAHAGRRAPLCADAVVRRLIRRQLDREVARVRRRTPVLVLAPTRRVVGAMGFDAMDARRRRLVSRMARTSTLAYLDRSGFAPLLAQARGTGPARPRSPAA
ncbi:MAG TPA: patatin-like phospholipase family protein [Acidimicrobiales bacterium]|nr:patatin-like phospholipase family protein [Acidimicrobiales bacterium]